MRAGGVQRSQGLVPLGPGLRGLLPPALPWGDLPVAAFLARCEVAAAGGGRVIRYLDRADLIRMRRAAGRPKDLRRASELELLALAG